MTSADKRFYSFLFGSILMWVFIMAVVGIIYSAELPDEVILEDNCPVCPVCPDHIEVGDD